MLKNVFLGVFFILLVVSGCAHVEEYNKASLFTSTTDAYDHAIRWSIFEEAANFLKPVPGSSGRTGVETLEAIRVTSYHVKRISFSEEKTTVRREVNIRYYHKNGLVEKAVRDYQVWEYDEENTVWYLISGLPRLK